MPQKTKLQGSQPTRRRSLNIQDIDDEVVDHFRQLVAYYGVPQKVLLERLLAAYTELRRASVTTKIRVHSVEILKRNRLELREGVTGAKETR